MQVQASHRNVGSSHSDPQDLCAILDATLETAYQYKDPLAVRMREVLYSLTGADSLSETVDRSIPGSFSAEVAARCIIDWPRTYRFVHAISDAVQRLDTREPGREIFAVDAGAGPFAFLMVVAALKSPRLHGLALEANRASVQHANSLISRLGLSNRIQVVEGDARTYRVDRPVDLFMTETFDAGLQQEQGAAILKNFSAYMSASGIMLPCAVSIEGAYRRIRGPLPMGNDAWRTLYRADYVHHKFQSGPVNFPLPRKAGTYEFFVSTRLDFGGDIAALDRYSGSAICTPTHVATFEVGNTPGTLLVSAIPGEDEFQVLVT